MEEIIKPSESIYNLLVDGTDHAVKALRTVKALEGVKVNSSVVAAQVFGVLANLANAGVLSLALSMSDIESVEQLAETRQRLEEMLRSAGLEDISQADLRHTPVHL